jgi:hypothetical protein
MAIFDFLFGSRNPPPVETTNISTTEIPKYIAEPTADIIGEAMDVAKEGYTPYAGPRLAGFNQDEMDAFQQARDMQGIAGLQQDQAYTAATASGAPALSSVPSYMTDYMTKVADVSAGKLRDQSLREQQDIAAKAVGAGGLDSSRFAILEAERQKNLQSGLGDLYTKAQAAAYDTALKASQQDRKQQAMSAEGMSKIGTRGQLGRQTDLGLLQGIGGLQRGQQQQAIDIGYTDFLQERDFPKEQLGFVSDIIRGAPFGQQTTSVGQTPGQRPAPFLSQLLGMGMQGANIYGSIFK